MVLLWSCVAGNSAIGLMAARLALSSHLNSAIGLMAARLTLSSHLNDRHLFSTIWYLLKIKEGIQL